MALEDVILRTRNPVADALGAYAQMVELGQQQEAQKQRSVASSLGAALQNANLDLDRQRLEAQVSENAEKVKFARQGAAFERWREMFRPGWTGREALEAWDTAHRSVGVEPPPFMPEYVRTMDANYQEQKKLKELDLIVRSRHQAPAGGESVQEMVINPETGDFEPIPGTIGQKFRERAPVMPYAQGGVFIGPDGVPMPMRWNKATGGYEPAPVAGGAVPAPRSSPGRIDAEEAQKMLNAERGRQQKAGAMADPDYLDKNGKFSETLFRRRAPGKIGIGTQGAAPPSQQQPQGGVGAIPTIEEARKDSRVKWKRNKVTGQWLAVFPDGRQIAYGGKG